MKIGKMGILRKDYFLNRWVFYASGRKKRPMEFKQDNVQYSSLKTCLFCPTNEHLTPREIGRVEEKGSWKIRWFPNKFPAVQLKGSPKLGKKRNFLLEGNTYGSHEVIVETRHHNKQLADLSVEHIKEVLEVCFIRIKALSKAKGSQYVTVFKNHGPSGGTSLVHSHMQVASLPILPSEIIEKATAIKKLGKCPYCSIIKLEAKSKRKIIETKNVVAFAPFASRFNYEAWIFPKRHIAGIELNDKELYDIALILKKLLLKLKKMNASYNFFFQYAPKDNKESNKEANKNNKFHFHIEVTPRIAKWAGFEFSTGAVINSVMPEDAVKFYRSG